MSKNGLHRHYDRLTPEERFRLDVLAMARGDAAESERLVDSCPKLSYRMNDRGFVGRWTGAIDITLRVRIPLEGLLSKLWMVDAFRQLVPYAQTLSRSVAAESYFIGHHLGSVQAWGEAGRRGRPSMWPELDAEKPEGADEDPAIMRDMEDLDRKVEKYGQLLPEILDRMERKFAQEAIDLWAGFGAFCDKGMGVGAKKIMAAALQEGAVAVAPIEELEALAERLGLEPDAESVEETRDARRRPGGWSKEEAPRVGLWGRLRRLEKDAEQEAITIRLKDGTTARFYEEEVWPGCFLHEYERGKRHYFGEAPGAAHPFVEALRNAADGELERLVPTQGTVFAMLLGEDEIIRGERERPGPPVKETSPGYYE